MSKYPLPLYLASAAIIYFMWRAFCARKEAWGIPALAVLATAAVWYVGDALYNDYDEFTSLIGADNIAMACWQLLLFVLVFAAIVRPMHTKLNHSLTSNGSFITRAFTRDVLSGRYAQRQLDQFAILVFIVWLVVMGIGLIRVDGDFLGLFAPYLAGKKAEPWARARIGEGSDGLLSLAGYIQILLTSAVGVIFALSRNPITRVVAGVLFFMSAPYYVFDRVRNTMIASLLPAILAWILLRVRANFFVKVGLLIGAFLVVNAWFSYVIANRTELGIANAFATGSGISGKESKHDGLNMLEELGWMNSFVAKGTYKPNWGQRYFAEIANPIPRSLWPGKPTIGIDYALARGMGENVASAKEGGIAASIATGMIGQGVANFGRFLGPVAAAILMSLWVSLLARQDLLGWEEPVRLLLYGNGLVLTFNMGRDITLLVLYPFFFGLLFVWIWLLWIKYVSGGEPLRKRRLQMKLRARKQRAHESGLRGGVGKAVRLRRGGASLGISK